MDRILRTATILVASAAFACAAASGSTGAKLSGTFQTKISGFAVQINGTYRLIVAPTGRYSLTRNGRTVVNGRGVVTPTTITFARETGPFRCPGTASYRWALRAKQLKLTPVRDACLGRKLILTARPLIKVA